MEWTASQLIQAFPWDTAPRYLLGDRDQINVHALRRQAMSMAMMEVQTALRRRKSPPLHRNLHPASCADAKPVVNPPPDQVPLEALA